MFKRGNRKPKQTIDLRDIPIPNRKLTLEEAREDYRTKVKMCKYCEFYMLKKEWYMDEDIYNDYCLVKDENCNEPCEYYQVKKED